MPRYCVYIWRREKSADPEVIEMVEAKNVDTAIELVMRSYCIYYANAAWAAIEGRSWREASRDEWRWKVRCHTSGKYSAKG